LWKEGDEWRTSGSTHASHEQSLPEARNEENKKKFPNIFLMVKAKGSQKFPAQLQYAALADM